MKGSGLVIRLIIQPERVLRWIDRDSELENLRSSAGRNDWGE